MKHALDISRTINSWNMHYTSQEQSTHGTCTTHVKNNQLMKHALDISRTINSWKMHYTSQERPSLGTCTTHFRNHPTLDTCTTQLVNMYYAHHIKDTLNRCRPITEPVHVSHTKHATEVYHSCVLLRCITDPIHVVVLDVWPEVDGSGVVQQRLLHLANNNMCHTDEHKIGREREVIE